MLPYGKQSLNDDDVQSVLNVLSSDWLTTGPAVDEFESDISRWTDGIPAVAVTSGTAALHAAYWAAGIGPGDVVLTSPLTFVATAATAAILGATVNFADVSEDTGNLDPDAVAASITARTRVVAGVDYAGHPIDADALLRLAHAHGALLLEDAAHSIGSSWLGRPVGALADLTTFSFFPTKNLTTAEGGAVVTPRPELLDRARRFKGQGLVRERNRMRYPDEGPWHQEVPEFGLNYRLPDVLCALGSSQLRRLGQFKQRRAEIHARYTAALADIPELRCPSARPGADCAWHLYPLRVLDGRRRELFEHLRDRGIGVQVNYVPVYWHPVFEDLGYKRGMCPVAEAYYSQELSLPLFADLHDEDVDWVISEIRSFFQA